MSGRRSHHRIHHYSLPIFTAALALLAGTARAELTISNAWVRAMPPTQRMTAAYMDLHNAGTDAVTIRGVTADGVGEASLHQTRREGDRVRMEAVEVLTVPAGGHLSLAPGGLHLMLMGLASMPAAGEVMRLCLELDRDAVCSDAEVRRDAPAAAGGHSH